MITNKSKFYGKFFKSIAIKRRKEKQFYSKGKIFASAVSTGCELQLRFSFEGIEKKPTFIWHGAEYSAGNGIHESIQEDLKHCFKDKVKSEKFYPVMVDGVRINAKIDSVFNNMVHEFKTVDDKPDEPRQKDVVQANFYLGATKLQLAVISYFNRRGIHLASFEVSYNEQLYKESLNKISRVINNKDLHIDTNDCAFCPYKYACKHSKN